MRSLVFSALCKEKGNDARRVMAKLALSADEQIIDQARSLITAGYNSSPKVLDMFGGGGTIPFEAKRLGLDVYTIDSNQLSVFIQKCNMIYADRIDIKDAEK